MGIAGFFTRPFSWLLASRPKFHKEHKNYSFDQSLSLAYTPLERMLCNIANDDAPTPIQRPANDMSRPRSRDHR